ncbi:MAG TPA: tRNA lysidine(34) synthetase TilS [Acidimicrobiales bacterium]|nr:tRNA lysidine(34) synthetase TilS [Acidimicrobiales bacterium]
MARAREARGWRFLIDFEEHAERLLGRCRFPPAETPVTCAVSGGADSTALLILAVASGCSVTAVHVDHGLRAGSAAEADVVAQAAERFGAGFVAVRAEVEFGPNLEARARAARAAVLPTDVLTGHTADDQAETLLLNLVRGSGVDGLSGIGRQAQRPLLNLRRAETAALCAAAGLEVVVDPTNTDPRFTRNRMRHEVLPLLAQVAQRDPVPLLCRLADLAGDEGALLDELARQVDPTDCDSLARAPAPLARRALRSWLRSEFAGYAPDAAAVERALAVARGEAVGADVVSGVSVRRTRGRLRIERAAGDR